MSQTPPPVGVPTCYRHPGREAHIRCQRCNRPICPDCMNSAAVGFQCPECLHAGQRETRSGRTRYGGLRPTDASLTSMVLIGINAVVWLLINVTGRYTSSLYDVFSLKARGVCELGESYFPNVHSAALCHTGSGTHWAEGVSDGAYWQLITAGFGHVEIWHLASNMLFLYLVGPQLEAVLGRTRFLALYFISLLAGSVLVYWAANTQDATLGASGAIFGLMGALLVIVLRQGVDPRQILMLIGLNFVITFAISGISWQGHVGGFLGGAAVAAVIAWSPRGPRRTTFQAGGLVAIAAVLIVLTIVRTAAVA
ncbi:MAG: rhomboid family intramembrane serine protease [Nocardioides sp.]|uniref:rhomboid family intramembrane serine protease n=1 Tax=Nocardioides sp. TaxID=35761 RepID=UPI0039E563DB